MNILQTDKFRTAFGTTLAASIAIGAWMIFVNMVTLSNDNVYLAAVNAQMAKDLEIADRVCRIRFAHPVLPKKMITKKKRKVEALKPPKASLTSG